MPIAPAAVSLPRSASRNLPVVPRRTSTTSDPDDGEHRHAEQEERVVARGRTRAAARRAGPGRRSPSRAARRCCRTSTRTRTWRARGRCRRAAAPGSRAARRPRAASTAPISIVEQHRQAPLVHQLRGREPADRGERRLAQRDLAGHAGDHRDRQEDHAEDDRLGHDQQPERVERERREHEDDARRSRRRARRSRS